MINVRLVISAFLLATVLATVGCLAPVSIQIGGTKNSAEQNRQAPPANASIAVATPLPVQPSEAEQQAADELAHQQKLADEQKLADQQKPDEENRVTAENEPEEGRQVVGRQRAEEQRRAALANDYADQQRRAEEQQLAIARNQRIAEEQLAEIRRQREAEERRLAELRSRAATPVTVLVPEQRREVTQNQRPSDNRQVYIYRTEETEQPKKKGHSTRKKILVGAAIGGAAVLGIWAAKH